MAESLSGISLAAKLLATLNNAIDGVTSGAAASQGFTWTPPAMTTGTSLNQADRIWTDTARILASAATEDLDLYDLAAFDIGAGAGRDAMGQTWALVEVVALLVASRTTSVGDLRVGGKAATTAWNSPFNADDDALVVVKPGGFFFLFAPTDPAYAVADVSNHLLKFLASGGDVTYDVAVMGRSA